MVQVDQLPRDRKMVSIPRVERLSGFGNCSRNFFETHVSEDTLILLNLLLGPAAKLSLGNSAVPVFRQRWRSRLPGHSEEDVSTALPVSGYPLYTEERRNSEFPVGSAARNSLVVKEFLCGD